MFLLWRVPAMRSDKILSFVDSQKRHEIFKCSTKEKHGKLSVTI